MRSVLLKRFFRVRGLIGSLGGVLSLGYSYKNCLSCTRNSTASLGLSHQLGSSCGTTAFNVLGHFGSFVGRIYTPRFIYRLSRLCGNLRVGFVRVC